jgi:parallel beta-helix repeat protein
MSALAAGALLVLAACGSRGELPKTVQCTRYASPEGADGASGTRRHPFRTVSRLTRRLAAGEVGCLRSGSYRGDVRVSRSGIVLQAAPGERAHVVGRMWISSSDVTVRGLYLNGRNPKRLPSPTVTAPRVRFVENDLTNEHTGICLLLGTDRWGHADGAHVERNRIHGCGTLPATNLNHGIYAEAVTGAVIRDNWIYGNADYGVHLYPNADRTLITGNVIYGNGGGVTFSGDGGEASSNNVVERNVIVGSRIRDDVESFWPRGNPVGRGNLVRSNCLGKVAVPQEGFRLEDNVAVAPRFTSSRDGDLRLQPGGRCAKVLQWPARRVPGPESATARAGTDPKSSS